MDEEIGSGGETVRIGGTRRSTVFEKKDPHPRLEKGDEGDNDEEDEERDDEKDVEKDYDDEDEIVFLKSK